MLKNFINLVLWIAIISIGIVGATAIIDKPIWYKMDLIWDTVVNAFLIVFATVVMCNNKN